MNSSAAALLSKLCTAKSVSRLYVKSQNHSIPLQRAEDDNGDGSHTLVARVETLQKILPMQQNNDLLLRTQTNQLTRTPCIYMYDCEAA